MRRFSLNQTSNAPTPNSPRGFTLIEMMVATALVVLMMLMFAQIFQTSSNLVSNQKGMAELDQSVRTLTILLRGDIKQRTFIDVVPFVRDQNTENDPPPYDDRTGKGYEPEYRKGFFSISENDANDPTDDVLHMTIRSNSPLAKRFPVALFRKTPVVCEPPNIPLASSMMPIC